PSGSSRKPGPAGKPRRTASPAPRRRRAALRTDAGRRVALRTGAGGRGAARSGNGTGSRAADTVTHQRRRPGSDRTHAPAPAAVLRPAAGAAAWPAMGATPSAIRPYSTLSTSASQLASIILVETPTVPQDRPPPAVWMSTRTFAPVAASSSRTRTL